jgi:ABC-2 type transport system ATP-binding protein
MEEADYLCDRIGIINSGKMVIEGDSNYLKDNFGGYKTLKLNLNKPIDDLTEQEITSMDVKINNKNDELLITGKNIEEMIPEIIKIIEKHGYNIIKLNMDQSSLEDVFFEVVK